MLDSILTRILFIIILCVFRCSAISACECQLLRGEKWSYAHVEEQLRKNQHVFIGQVLSHTNHSFQVKVLDVFKGQIDQQVLVGTYNGYSSCATSVREGLWIFYTTLAPDGSLPAIDACSFSGSLTHPELSLVPPKPGALLDSVAQHKLMEDQQLRQSALFMHNWLSEYTILTTYRSKMTTQGPSLLLLYVFCSTLIILVVALLYQAQRNAK
ncbi:hypothetical protein DNI29_14785 [Hymenobacter sediminis]|uniref:hypothetical protein n=1 Tax=Hymenobacter sediminis TaxID=2218621 RepID=UPI000DA6642A|nr:hypothetical protein [Hymenobacter sediminis]RPD46265.1 hypothetical protein DNI29_14785 [Hymenobacter sediminis]